MVGNSGMRHWQRSMTGKIKPQRGEDPLGGGGVIGATPWRWRRRQQWHGHVAWVAPSERWCEHELSTDEGVLLGHPGRQEGDRGGVATAVGGEEEGVAACYGGAEADSWRGMA